jgi:hypothetical protein
VDGVVALEIVHTGPGPLALEAEPSNFYSTGNNVRNSGFESLESGDGWEIPRVNTDVLLLLDRSTSMVGEGWSGPDPCVTACDVLGYSAGEAHCAGETYPDCEDCDGRNPSLSLMRRRDDVYKDHSFPLNVHYEGNCPYNEEKQGALEFMSFMDPSKDRVGVISFSGRPGDYNAGDRYADLEVPLTFDHSDVTTTVDSMFLGLNTGITAAINYSMAEFESNPRDSTKYIILLTDGQETLSGEIFKGGESSDPVSQAQIAASRDIVIYTIGYGSEADEAMLQQIADETEGGYFYADISEELTDIFSFIAMEIIAGVDHEFSKYGNRSLKFPAGNDVIFYSTTEGIDTNTDQIVSQYIKAEGITSGTVEFLLYLYENEAKAQSFSEDHIITLQTFPAPVADFDFTKFSKIIAKGDIDNDCAGSPCEYGRLAYHWSSGTPLGTVWIDDVFFGEYLPYFSSLGHQSAMLGDITIAKQQGGGDMYPYVSKSSVEPRERFRIRDANCGYGVCKYRVSTLTSSADATAYCPK